MAWGLDDLADWLDDVINGAQVVAGNRSATNIPGVNQNVNAAIVNPANIGLEFTGAKDFGRGIKPNASTKDRALALLALSGNIGSIGAADDIGRVASRLEPKYAYGLHVSPVNNLKKIKPGSKVGMGNGGNFGDAEKGYSYFFNTGKNADLTNTQMAVNEYLDRLAAGSRDGVNVYSVRTPLRKVSEDSNMNVGSFNEAMKALGKLKVKGSIKQRPMIVTNNWMSPKYSGPEFPENSEELINNLGQLIKSQKPNSSKSIQEIVGGFRNKMDSVLQKEMDYYLKQSAKEKPKKVEVKSPKK